MLQEVLIEEMQDLLHAENQLVKALPKMAKAANSEELSSAFKDHLEQTKGHVERLKRAFELLGAKAKAKPCKGMAGLVEEGQEVITEGKGRTRLTPTWRSSPPPRKWNIMRSPDTAAAGRLRRSWSVTT